VRDLLAEDLRPAKRARPTAKKSTKKSLPGLFILSEEKREVFAQLSAAERVTWIASAAKKLGGSFAPGAAQRLVALCNNDSWRVAAEVEKLVAYASPKPVTVDDVEMMVASESNSDIFALTDALGQRRSDRALALVHQELAAGMNGFALIATLAGHVRTLYQVKQASARGSSPANLASELAIHPFVAQKALAQTNNFTADELRDLHHRLVTIDHDLKTSPLDAETLLDMLMIRPSLA